MQIGSRDKVISLTVVGTLTVLAVGLEQLPGLDHLGSLALALLLGLAWRAWLPVPDGWQQGLSFAAKRLLRIGIILLGVRLNIALIAEAGLKIVMIDFSVITVGLIGISWLGRRFGLDPLLAMLIAVDSSICGGSAVAAAAPVIRAREHEVALVIPLCSLIGTAVMLGYTLMQHSVELSSEHYGMLVGSSLHEVAQVVAAVTPFPDAVEIGTVTKLTRVIFLVPVIGILGWIFARKRAREGAADQQVVQKVPKPWFVLGFLLVGVANTLGWRYLPEYRAQLSHLDENILKAATFLMGMAMAAMGLQTDFVHLRENGGKALRTAVLGWMMIASVSAFEIWMLSR